MVPFKQLVEPRSGHGLQAMMLRWEQLQPVNAAHVAWLRGSFPAAQIEAAATRVFERLLQVSPRDGAQAARHPEKLFEFQEYRVAGDWRPHLQQAMTNELNSPFPDGRTPFRVRVINVNGRDQFLILAYRHVISDARAIALLCRELIWQLTRPGSRNSRIESSIGRHCLRDLYPAEFDWRRSPAVAGHLAREWWMSRRCLQLKAVDPNDLRMEFRMHQTSLPLAALKSRCHRLGATANDLILASALEWLAIRLPERRNGRPDLALATLVDLCSRGDVAQPLVFGQFLSQFVVRAPVTADDSFAKIVRLVASQTASQKQVRPLICNSIGFALLSRLWDLLPLVRKPKHLPAVLPLLGGVSNVNLSSMSDRDEMPAIVHNYFRGTCVTNLLPMMLSVTSFRDTVSLTTTHRPVYFSADQMDDLAAHVGRRLCGESTDVEIFPESGRVAA